MGASRREPNPGAVAQYVAATLFWFIWLIPWTYGFAFLWFSIAPWVVRVIAGVPTSALYLVAAALTLVACGYVGSFALRRMAAVRYWWGPPIVAMFLKLAGSVALGRSITWFAVFNVGLTAIAVVFGQWLALRTSAPPAVLEEPA